MLDLQKMETYLLTNKHGPRISPHLQANELAVWTLVDFFLFVLLFHKYSLPKTPKWLSSSLLQHPFPKLQSLCYSWINSISCNLSLSRFTSLFRVTWTIPRITLTYRHAHGQRWMGINILSWGICIWTMWCVCAHMSVLGWWEIIERVVRKENWYRFSSLVKGCNCITY